MGQPWKSGGRAEFQWLMVILKSFNQRNMGGEKWPIILQLFKMQSHLILHYFSFQSKTQSQDVKCISCLLPYPWVTYGTSRRDGDMQRICPLARTSPGLSVSSSNTHVTPAERFGTLATFTLSWNTNTHDLLSDMLEDHVTSLIKLCEKSVLSRFCRH